MTQKGAKISHVVKVVTTMGKKCIAFGCSKTHKDDVSLFKFPTESNLRRAWILQVKRTRDKWDGPSEHSTLCSDHFTEDCFESMSVLSKQMGLKSKQLLKPSAIPTLFPRPASVPASKRPRTSRAYEKREKARVRIIISKHIIVTLNAPKIIATISSAEAEVTPPSAMDIESVEPSSIDVSLHVP